MSEIYIHYPSIEESIRKSEKARHEMSNYIGSINSSITNPISRLPGSDVAGYTSTARSLAYNKIHQINEKITALRTYESGMRNFISFAKDKDNYVSRRISEIADAYIEKRSLFQQATDWIYNTFCVDLANKSDLIRSFTDCVKWLGGKIKSTVNDVKDWFKYGNGKYVFNIASAVVASVAAVAGVVIAVAAIPVTGGASATLIPTIIGVVGACATTVGAAITIVNSTSKIEGNAKALILKDQPGAARYYGNISTIHEEWSKTDKGDAATNKRYEVYGKVIDTTKVAADTTSFICNIANLGTVRDYRFKDPTKQIKGYSFTKDNIVKNIKHDMGFLTSTGKLDLKKAFNLKKGFLATNYKEKFMVGGNLVIPEFVYQGFHLNKKIKNTLGVVENKSSLYENLKKTDLTLEDIGEITESATGLLSYTKFTSIFNTYGTKTGNTIGRILSDGYQWQNLIMY